MTGIIVAILIAVILYPQARNAWGNVPAVVLTAVGMGLGLTIGLFALPYFALGLYARHVAMQKAIAGSDEPGIPGDRRE